MRPTATIMATGIGIRLLEWSGSVFRGAMTGIAIGMTGGVAIAIATPAIVTTVIVTTAIVTTGVEA